jgi:hypothetical protein
MKIIPVIIILILSQIEILKKIKNEDKVICHLFKINLIGEIDF